MNSFRRGLLEAVSLIGSIAVADDKVYGAHRLRRAYTPSVSHAPIRWSCDGVMV